ncbi:hypothetical protein Tco_0489936 [Tanacetum coccineum]
MENVDVAGLPRHLVKQSFNHLLKITNPTKKLSDPFGDDSKPRSYDVTFSNLLFDFNDDYTLCYDNPLFDEEFEEISSLDPPELTPVIDESTLLVTLPLPYLVVLGDEKIDLLLRDDLDTLLTRDREIDFNPCRDIEELECLLANDPVLIPRAFDEPLGNSDSMSRQFETSDLILEELTTEIGLDDSISTDIDDSLDPFVEIPSGKSKVHIEVLSVLWGNRLPIPNGSLPLSRLSHPRSTSKRLKGSFAISGEPSVYVWYTKDSGFELTGFLNADYAGCKDTFKSTSGGAQFLGEKLVSWSSNKQDCTTLSTAKAEYVSLSACCAQVLWMRTQLTDYGYHFDKIPIYCDSKSTIAISYNPVQYSKTKHIVVRYHFIKEHV